MTRFARASIAATFLATTGTTLLPATARADDAATDPEPPVPRGHHVETEPRRGLWVTGLSVAGGTYAMGLTIFGAFAFACSGALGSMMAESGSHGETHCSPTLGQSAWLLVPVAGPAVLYTQTEGVPGRGYFASFTVGQVLGLGLAGTAFLFPTKKIVADDTSVAFAPAPGGGVLSLSGAL